MAERIALGLELSLSQLLRLDEGDGVSVVRADERRRGGGREHRYEVLTPPLPGLRAEVSLHTLAPGAVDGRARTTRRCTRPAAARPRSWTRGPVRFVCGGAAHDLEDGDSVTFDADLPHHFENPGDGRGALLRRRRRRPEEELTVPKTLFDKIWEAHEVADALLYIDLHLVHEVTSRAGLRGLRLAGRKVRRPDRTLATADHNVPDRRLHRRRSRSATSSRACRWRRSSATAREFGIPIYSIGSQRQGIVHVIGPELGVTQPGMTIVCGDSHTSTHGAFGALAFGIGTSEVEHVLATQTLQQRKPRSMRIRYEGELGYGVTAKDLILAHDRPDGRGRRRGPRDRVRRPGRSRRSRWRAA